MKKLILSLILVALVGCFLYEEKSDIKMSGGDIVLRDDEIFLEKESLVENATSRAAIADNEFEYRIKLVAQIKPIIIDGLEVQANDIKIYGGKAFIVYNTANEEYSGALQIVDISKPAEPSIKDYLIFADKDINSVYYNEVNGDIIIGGGEKRAGDNGAFITRVKSSKLSISDFNNNKIELPSKQLTSITEMNARYYFSVGASTGALLSLEENFTKTSIYQNEYNTDDIRDIENTETEILSLYSNGTNGFIKGRAAEIVIGNFTSIEHKSTLEYFKTGEEDYLLDYEDGFIFLGLGEQGFKIVKLGGDENADSVIFETENPQGELEIASNSVSYDAGFIFWALGEYGFKVLKLKGLAIIDEITGETGYDENKFVESIGYHSLDRSFYTSESGRAFSANHIVFKKNVVKEQGKNIEKNYLFVASGVGGVNIYNLIQKDEYEILDIDNKIRTEMNKKLLGKKIVESNDEIINSPDIKLIQDAKITVTFLTEQAGYKNSIGLIIYDDNPQNIEALTTIEVFKNASKGGGGGALAYGDSKYIGDFSTGKNIGVYIDSDGFNNVNAKRFYSVNSLNSDGKDHFAMYKTYKDDNENELVYIYAIEDTEGLGDGDYNDVIIMITVDASDAVGNLSEINFSGI